jgi:hypothetical protein
MHEYILTSKGFACWEQTENCVYLLCIAGEGSYSLYRSIYVYIYIYIHTHTQRLTRYILCEQLASAEGHNLQVWLDSQPNFDLSAWLSSQPDVDISAWLKEVKAHQSNFSLSSWLKERPDPKISEWLDQFVPFNLTEWLDSQVCDAACVDARVQSFCYVCMRRVEKLCWNTGFCRRMNQ